ncbi:MAG: ABC transporter substrate-binding protein [Gammaproteobacteria bacterium]
MKEGFLAAVLVLLSICFFPTSAFCTPRLPPQEVVKSTADQVLRVLEAEQKDLRAHPERVYDVVNEYILPNFSFPAMSRLVLGRHWRSATDLQRQQFTDAFRSLLVRTYADSLIDYTGVPIRYLPVHMEEKAKDATVHTEIKPSTGPAVTISYRLRLISGEWKVIDVVVEGVSLITNYRTEFSTEISQSGLDSLISSLQARAPSPVPKNH